jgi:hypothetical protein
MPVGTGEMATSIPLFGRRSRLRSLISKTSFH